MYEYTANAYLYTDCSISGLVQVLQNMQNTVTIAQRIDIRTPEIQTKTTPPKTGPKNKWEIKTLQNQKDSKEVEQN